MEAPHTGHAVWPSLPLEAWRDTYATLHLWLQIVRKVALVRSPWINHAWRATLNVTASGLATAPVAHGDRVFQIQFDFIEHELLVTSSDGRRGG